MGWTVYNIAAAAAGFFQRVGNSLGFCDVVYCLFSFASHPLGKWLS